MGTKRWDSLIGAVALVAFGFLLAENTVLGMAHPDFFRRVNLAFIAVFAVDVATRIVLSKDPRRYLKAKWFDLIVFVPLIQYVSAIASWQFFVVVRQAVIVTMLISRSRKAGRFIAMLGLRPTQLMIASFLFAIGIGTVLLMLPMASASGERTGLVDALFTATSATCVTGLIVQDTAAYFSPLGQVIILALIQIGGLGIMTFSASLAILLRKPVQIKQRAAMQDILDHSALQGLQRLILFILALTVVTELAGGLVLTILWLPLHASAADAVFHAFFHSVSAFCNAGFSTFSDSLVRFQSSLATNGVICALIIIGGLGFMVIKDLFSRRPEPGTNKRPRRYRVQTKIVLTTSAVLLAGGTLCIYFTERPGMLTDLPFGTRLLVPFFQSVTARTAGFNTVDIGALAPATLFILIALMFVGGSPGSTAGGIKTTTLAVIWSSITGSLRRRSNAEMFRRTIPAANIQRAFTLFCISITAVVCFTALLLHTEHMAVADILFETVSAFGTVGLSTGITPRLSQAGRLLVVLLMFVGRLGPLTIAYAFVRQRLPAKYEYAEESIVVG